MPVSTGSGIINPRFYTLPRKEYGISGQTMSCPQVVVHRAVLLHELTVHTAHTIVAREARAIFSAAILHVCDITALLDSIQA
jgi:hypothetical protein